MKNLLTKFKSFFNPKNELIILYTLFAAMLVCANCIATKQIPIGRWFGVDVSITVGVICYPVTFLITDIIGEKFGKKEATMAVIAGLVAQVVAIIFVVIANAIPGNDKAVAEQFNGILGSNWILTIGSLTACLLSQTWDVWVFHKIRNKYIEKHGSTKGGRWIWNNASTITSQLIDSVVFYCFLLLMLHTQGVDLPINVCFITVFAYWVIKLAIAVLDTPFFYLLTNKYGKKDEQQE